MIEKASKDVVANVEGLVEGYNHEIPDLIEFIKEIDKEIKEQKHRVNVLNKQKSDIQRFLEETDEGIELVEEHSEILKSEIGMLRDRVGISVDESNKTLNDMQESVGSRITSLEFEKNHLKERLKRAHRILKSHSYGWRYKIKIIN